MNEPESEKFFREMNNGIKGQRTVIMIWVILLLLFFIGSLIVGLVIRLSTPT